MGSIYLRKYGVAATVDFCLYELDGTDLVTNAASASGDINLIRDEGPPEQLDADAFVDEGVVYSLVLSVAEMTAARITVYIIDQSNPKIWLDKVLLIETYGHASAQHAFDLSVATQDVNVTYLGGAAQSATDLKDFTDSGYDPATHKVQGVVLCDTTTTNTDMITAATVNAQCDTALSDIQLDHLIQTSIGAGKPTAGTLFDLIMNIDALQTFDRTTDSLEAISSLTAEAITDILAIDAKVDAIKAITDLLTLAGIADAVLDEAVEGAYTQRELLRLISAALVGKTSEAIAGTLVIRDTNDTADRITATMDANRYRTGVVLNP